MFASDQSDMKLHCKWFKIEKGVNYEDIISELKPYSLLLYVSNESFIEKVRSKTLCILLGCMPHTNIGCL